MVVAKAERVVEVERPQELWQLEQVGRLVVRGDRELRAVRHEGLARTVQRAQLRTFDLELDERGVGRFVVDRDHRDTGGTGRARIDHPRLDEVGTEWRPERIAKVLVGVEVGLELEGRTLGPQARAVEADLRGHVLAEPLADGGAARLALLEERRLGLVDIEAAKLAAGGARHLDHGDAIERAAVDEDVVGAELDEPAVVLVGEVAEHLGIDPFVLVFAIRGGLTNGDGAQEARVAREPVVQRRVEAEARERLVEHGGDPLEAVAGGEDLVEERDREVRPRLGLRDAFGAREPLHLQEAHDRRVEAQRDPVVVVVLVRRLEHHHAGKLWIRLDPIDPHLRGDHGPVLALFADVPVVDERDHVEVLCHPAHLVGHHRAAHDPLHRAEIVPAGCDPRIDIGERVPAQLVGEPMKRARLKRDVEVGA